MALVEKIPLPPNPFARPLTESTESSAFFIDARNRSFKHQYANIYFLRLRQLRAIIEERAEKRWKNVQGSPVLVPRVLEVSKNQLCYIIGTVYIDMMLKPNILEDLGRDHSIPAPPPRDKFFSDDDTAMLEDESGRIVLVGDRIAKAKLVTGIIIAALGVETSAGGFEVIDICYPGMAPQVMEAPDEEEQMEVDDVPDEWVGLVSGLDIGSPTSISDAQTQLLVEYLTSEGGSVADQASSSTISRLILAGNSLTPPNMAPFMSMGQMEVEAFEKKDGRKPRRYGYDASNFSSRPTEILNAHLADIAQCMPVHILPGASDPSGVTLPQQAFPRAMFGAVAAYSSFTSETNPAHIALSTAPSPSGRKTTRKLLVHAGQPIDDMFKYLPTPPTTRLGLAALTLKWRHIAPTAPDTLWCHPYFTTDPFILAETPDIYVVGCQPKFATRLVVDGDGDEGGNGGDASQGSQGQGKRRCRIILVPNFAKTGVLVLVNLRSLEVKTVQFATQGFENLEPPSLEER